MRARIIANPKSGSDRAASLLPAIVERLRPFAADVDITVTLGEGDVVRAASRAVAEGSDLVVAVGGDGTLNGVVRTIAAAPRALERVTFGLIPAGTGNDFAKALGLGEDADGALAALADPHVVDVDLGLLNDRAFCNTSAGGFVADVSAVLTEQLKDTAGKLAYLIGGARALFGREPFAAELRLPGGATPYPAAVDLQMFAVCNARFIGGGYPIAPAALIDDGLLDVFLVKRTATLDFVRLLQKFAAGEGADDERVLHFRASELDLIFDRPVRVNTDGEVLLADACRYRTLAGAARFLCGATPQTSRAPRPLVV